MKIPRRLRVKAQAVGLLESCKMGPIICPETSATTNLRCVTSQKNQGLKSATMCIGFGPIINSYIMYVGIEYRRNWLSHLQRCTINFMERERHLQITADTECVKLLKPTCYVMHQQFNIQQLYALPALYLCVLYLSENKQRLVPLTA